MEDEDISRIHWVGLNKDSYIDQVFTIIFSCRYTWAHEVCVWWTAQSSRHHSNESVQACLSQVDVLRDRSSYYWVGEWTGSTTTWRYIQHELKALSHSINFNSIIVVTHFHHDNTMYFMINDLCVHNYWLLRSDTTIGINFQLEIFGQKKHNYYAVSRNYYRTCQGFDFWSVA